MSTQQPDYSEKLADILSRDADLKAEVEAVRSQDAAAGAGMDEDENGLPRAAYYYAGIARPVMEFPEPEQPGPQLVEEADAQPATDGAGPSILVHDNDVGDLRARVVTTWQKRLQKAGQPLRKAIAAVGRIEVKGNGDLTVAGTGFLVGEDVIATNQHVAAQFAEPDGGGGFVPRLNLGGEEMEASIDFLEELGNSKSLTFPVVEVLRMDADDDVAFLRVGRQSAEGGPLPQPIEFFTDAVQPGQLVAAIGYPQRDTRKEHAAELEAIFHDIFDKKRVSPGEIRGTDAKGRVVHDCSVLRGSSGSPVTDLATGKVVGIHFVGEFLKINLAVPAPKAQEVLDTIDPPLPVAA